MSASALSRWPTSPTEYKLHLPEGLPLVGVLRYEIGRKQDAEEEDERSCLAHYILIAPARVWRGGQARGEREERGRAAAGDRGRHSRDADMSDAAIEDRHAQP